MTKDKLIEEVLSGIPVTAFEIIDAHGHLGYWHNFYNAERSAADMVHALDRIGARCIIAAAHAGISTDFRRGNTQVIEAMREFPGRIHGYCCVNPNYPDEIPAELDRCFEAGMVGIKFHPNVHRYPVDGDNYRFAWEFADKHGLVILTHTGVNDSTCGVTQVGACAERYPNAKVLFGHSGFGYAGARACVEVGSRLPNTYFDITASTTELGLIEILVDGLGADRVLYGTDLPFIDCRMQIGRLAFSRLDDDQLRLILADNAKRLFGLSDGT